MVTIEAKGTISVKGRNGYFRLAMVEVLKGDTESILFFNSARSGKNSPMTIRGTNQEVKRLLTTIARTIK